MLAIRFIKLHGSSSITIFSFLIVAIALFAPVLDSFAQQQTITLNGAGATFPYPLIDTWRNEYQKVRPNVNINYQSIGSGGGVKQFTEKTVDFGASDAPLSESEMEKTPNAIHIPETIGSIVVSYNLPTVPDKGLRLSGSVIADIFLGKIAQWNDPSIVALNPGMALPDSNIVVVHRSDGSGTTFVWTDYLSKVSPEWHDKIGTGKSVEWPTGVGAPGNEGVTNAIKGTQNTIGYIELSYAISTGMPYAFLENKEGNFIEPSFDSISAAIAASITSLPKGDERWTGVSTTNAAGKNSYPIASLTYLLVYKELADNPSITRQKAAAMVDFVLWAITDGQQFSKKLGYVPLPPEVIELNKETIHMLTFQGQPVVRLAGQEHSPQGWDNYLPIFAGIGIAAALALYLVKKRVRQHLPAEPADGRRKLAPFFLRSNRLGDKMFRALVMGTAGYTAFLLTLVAYSAFAGSSEAFAREGFFGFVAGVDWNAVEGRESYGALPYVIGTLASAGIAMLIGVPVSIGIATFVSEISPRKLAAPLSFVVELLAAVPSIIYGLWALFVFRFWVKDLIEVPLNNLFGDTIPMFARTPLGLDIFTAGIVLAIMIIPTVSSVAREVMRAVPNSQREAAYSLGATRWETVKTAVFPYARSGMLGASILGLGRAVGETMLVTMVVGNSIGLAAIPNSLFAPSQTLASLIANEFNEAVTSFNSSALIGLGAVLLLLTIAINVGARLMVSRITRAGSGKRAEKSQKITKDKNYDVLTSTSTYESGKSRQLIQAQVRNDSSKRKLLNATITVWTLACVVAAIIPLGSILIEVVKNGAPAIDPNFLTQPPGALGSGEGGIGPAIQGTLIVVGLATAIGAPIGVMTGIYLSEYAGTGANTGFAYVVRFFNDVLTGLPSIVVGIVAYVTIVLATGTFSVGAGAFALSIIMIPIVVRVTEETLKIVPTSIREAAYSLGIPRWKIALLIILPTAKSGVLTGIILAVSRITGETAPLIMTILGTSLFFTGFAGPVDALPLRIWRLASQPYPEAHSFGWGAALILIFIVLGLSMSLRVLSQRKAGYMPAM